MDETAKLERLRAAAIARRVINEIAPEGWCGALGDAVAEEILAEQAADSEQP